MGIDILLLSTPNKNIDYPGLSLPILSAALRHAGVSVEQQDINITFRDSLVTEEGLSGILEDSIPAYAHAFSGSEVDAKRLLSIFNYFSRIKDNFGFESIAEVKVRAQAREYEGIFEEDALFGRYLSLFKINRALHYLIDIAVSLSYDHYNDYLTEEVKKNLREIAAQISISRPSIVGISILDIQRHYSLRLIEHIRDEYPGKIIVGGADPTRFAREYIENCKEIDAVFCREAEISLPLYVESLPTGDEAIKKISGIVFRDADGNMVVNRQKPVDLTTIQSPDFRGLPLDLYLTPALPIQASRGCYWQQCRFCIHWDTYCDFRMRSPAKVLEDVETLARQHKTRYFHFTDDCLPIQKIDEFRELLRLFRESNVNARWLAYLRFEDEVDRPLLEEIFSAGGRVLEIGLESASSRILKSMRKNISVAVADRIVEDASSIELLVKVFMFHGYPGEGIADAKQTIDFAERHIYGKRIRPFLPLRNRFELLKGSDIYRSVLAGTEKGVTAFWEPSGLFSIRAEYMLHSQEIGIQDLIGEFVDRARGYMKTNKIYSTDDENVMLDLLVLEERPLRSEWRCI